MDTSEARQAIETILNDADIIIEFKHVPTTFDPKSKEWQGIKWAVTFKSPRGHFTTDYMQGIGHLPGYKPGKPITLADEAVIVAQLKTGMVCEYVDGFNKARPTLQPIAKPSPADVVYSLVLDAIAADYATFEEWARDMGGDPDSRKEEKIFNACRQIAFDLNRVFGATAVERLREPAQSL